VKKSGGFLLKSKINLTKRPNVLKQFSLMDEDNTNEGEEQPKFKKIKLLDDSDDEDTAKSTSIDTNSSMAMDIDKDNTKNDNGGGEEEEVDALDAYMKDVRKEVEEIKKQDELSMKQNNENSSRSELPIDVDQDDNDYSTEEEDEEDILALAAKRLAKRKDLIAVDHSTIQYEPFRKNFYIEPPELGNMKQAEVEQVRRELDNIKVQGSRCPKPVRKWTQFGLPTGCLEVIKKILKYQHPSPIQCQAIPAIMSGRDVISVAKTGSGKTIAFLLPMFRAIKDQRPLEPQEGPIALIMTPTRELAVQIYKECRHFTRVLGLNVTCAYGGSPIKDQIAELKKGAEIIVCTPGRMIDLLCANSGRVTNLRRVTYLVLDEADRMFDMGFEPQVMKIVNNIRPDRQTLLFSATFPRQIDALARKILTKPLEITVGGKSVVCEDVEQHVEVREEETKFRRLLEILGLYYKQDLNPRTLIFVDRQEAADNLLKELIRFGYPCQSLHGGKDQADRDSTIADFKSGVTNILIATSVAARGLDVKDLNLVINYECPNHLEDYVHRVGRTGRAGNKGTAYTFVTPQQDKYANDIVNALKMSHTEIPPELQKLADEFVSKVKAGNAHYSSSGFGGKGLERLDKEREASKKIQRKIHGAELDDEDEDNTDDEEEKLKDSIDAKIVDVSSSSNNKASNTTATAATAIPANKSENKIPGTGIEAEKIKAVQEIAALVNAKISSKVKKSMDGITPEIKNDSSLIKPANEPNSSTNNNNNDNSSLYAFEIEINDYPQKARWRVTNRDQITMLTELTGAAITTRGTFFPPGKQPGPNERKLYLFIEGETQLIVDKAKTEIKRILTEATLSCIEAEARGTGSEATGRYTVI
jgi:ATP-dependent RNA helicase DDX46/PRP5